MLDRLKVGGGFVFVLFYLILMKSYIWSAYWTRTRRSAEFWLWVDNWDDAKSTIMKNNNTNWAYDVISSCNVMMHCLLLRFESDKPKLQWLFLLHNKSFIYQIQINQFTSLVITWREQTVKVRQEGGRSSFDVHH